MLFERCCLKALAISIQVVLWLSKLPLDFSFPFCSGTAATALKIECGHLMFHQTYFQPFTVYYLASEKRFEQSVMWCEWKGTQNQQNRVSPLSFFRVSKEMPIRTHHYEKKTQNNNNNNKKTPTNPRPLLRKQHVGVPFWSICTLIHTAWKPKWEIWDLCVVAGLWSCHYRNLVA